MEQPDLSRRLWAYYTEINAWQCRVCRTPADGGYTHYLSSLIQKNKARCVCSVWNNSFHFTMEMQLCNSIQIYLHNSLQTQICTRVEVYQSFIKVGILDPSRTVVKGYLLRPDFKLGDIFRETSTLDESEVFLFIYPLPWCAHGIHQFFGKPNLKLCNKFKDSGDRVFFMARPTLEDPLNGLDCFLYELRTDSWFRVIDDSGCLGHTIFFSIPATPTQVMTTLDYAQLSIAEVEGKDLCMELLHFLCCFPTYLEFCATDKQSSTWLLGSFPHLSELGEVLQCAQVSPIDA